MDIGIIYSDQDPRHIEFRDFVAQYVQERGILASIVETTKPVNSPTVVVNGHTLSDRRKKPRRKNSPMFPDKSAIARLLEKQFWSL